MRFVLQRVLDAKVYVEGELKGSIGKGYLLFVGVSDDDTIEIADKMIEKISRLRIFEDSNGKTNLSIDQICGEVMIISQFTLYADCRKGNRPSFTNAGSPGLAEEIYEHIMEKGRTLFKNTQQGVFGADMKVSLINDGPFTLILDSREILGV